MVYINEFKKFNIVMPVTDFVIINNVKIPVKDWSFTLFQLCDSLGIKIPRFCYHERLSIAGNCRMCMVEVSSSLKPVVACATSLTKGMTVFTNSSLAKRARENVLEFLLINHPLDCPICDQGGECDLQDQAVAYGSDRGRFAEVKRSVEDKSFGPIVKTVMTRCIHCTRCVRFFEEISGTPFLGTMGRGKDTEISTYVSLGMLHSNISGNVIDLCPVGALTSKPHAFLYRPWELTSIETVDTTDSLCSNVRVDLKGAEIVRILPKRNDLINEDWISDTTRYGYEGLKKNRLSIPMVRSTSTGEFISSGWSAFYDTFASFYASQLAINDALSISVDVGPSVDLFTVYLSHFFSKMFSVSAFTGNVSSPSFDFRNLFTLQPSLDSVDSSDLLLLFNLNLSTDFSVLQARFKKNNASILHIGLNGFVGLEHKHIGLSKLGAVSLYRGKHSFSTLLFSATKPHFLSSCSFHLPAVSFIKTLAKLTSSSLLATSSAIHAGEVGVFGNSILTGASINYNIESTAVISDSAVRSFSVYQGSNAHASKTQICTTDASSWYLPSCSSFEHRGFYLNLLGYIQLTRKCTTKIGLSLSNSDILLNLFIRLSKLHPFYKNSFSMNSSTFYSYFLDNVVIYVSDAMISKLSSSFDSSIASYSSVTSAASSSNVPYYVTYSSTLTSVATLRSVSVF